MSKQLGGAMSGGGGGGDAPRTPVTAPDSIRSQAIIEVVEAWGWGEIAGFPTADPLKHVYLDGTPIKSPDGALNFQGVTFDYRLGTQDQTYIPGIVDDAVGSPITVDVPVVHATPVTRTITDPTTDAVRIIVTFQGLVSQDTATGDKTGVTVNLQIEVKPAAGSWHIVDLQGRGTVSDKTESPYQRSFLVDLKSIDPVATSFDIRVTRLSADPTAAQNSAFKWDSLVKLTYAKLRRPNIPHCRLTFDSKYFSTIPTRSYDLMGWLIQVPTVDVYDPVARTYTGADWNGVLVKRWCRNPAWFFYHLLTTGGHGLGDDINPAYQDKWQIYKIAKRCDELVSDGNGGLEPRYSIDAQFMAQTSAHEMILQIAGIFDAQALWNGSSIYVTQDAPKQVSSLYLPANVVSGRFSYSSTARQVRYTAAMIQYNDPTDQYKLATEYVEDFDGIQRYGYRPKTETAIGCISRSEAHRHGKRLLVSGRKEIDSVVFSVGLSGINDKPGDIVRIADPLRSGGKRLGGRISTGSTASTINLDAPANLSSGISYRLTVIGNDGSILDSGITNAAGTHTAITVSPAFAAAPEHELEWIIYDPLAIGKTFRILGIIENEDTSNGFYTVSATQYAADKFAEIDDIADLEPIPENPYIVNGVIPPSGLTVQEGVYTALEGLRRYIDLHWTASNDGLLRGYHLSYRHNGVELFSNEVTGQSFRINNPLVGAYEITLSAVSVMGKYSSSITVSHTLGEMYAIESVSITGLALKAGGTTFAGKIAEAVWGTDALTVLGFSDTYATGSGGQSPWFRDFQVDVYTDSLTPVLLRSDFVTESAYAYTFEKNVDDGGPRRNIKLLVRARDYYGRYSIPQTLTVTNPAPPALTTVSVFAGAKALVISYTRPADNDWEGVIVFVDTVAGFTPSAGNRVYNGTDTTITIPNLLENTPYFIRLATYDAFGGIADYTLGGTEYTKTINSVSAPSPEDIKAGLQTALNDPAATPLIFEADTFAIKLNSTEVVPFIVGTHNGNPAILMDADVVVTGALSADQLTSGRMAATESITIGNGNAVINGNGSIMVYDGDDTVSNRDFALLSGGNLSFQRFRGGAYQNYKSVRRIEYGQANSGATVTLPGYWDAQPKIIVSPSSLKGYDSAQSGASQSWLISANNLVEYPAASGIWQFDAVAELTYSSSSGNQTVSSASGNLSTDSWISGESTLPVNTVSLNVTAQFSSVKGDGISTYGYYFRTVTWKIQGWNGTSWVDLATQARSLSQGEHGALISDQNSTNVTAGVYSKIRLSFVASNTNGTKYSLGADSWSYDTQYIANNGQTSIAANGDGGGGRIPITPTPITYTALNRPGWEIYGVQYSVSWDLASAFSYSGGWVAGNSSNNLVSVSEGVPNSHFDTSGEGTTEIAGVSPANTGSYTSSVISTSTFNQTFWLANANRSGDDYIYAHFTLSNASATVFLRKLGVNSGDSANNFTFQNYAWNIAGSSAIATGSLNWMAVGD